MVGVPICNADECKMDEHQGMFCRYLHEVIFIALVKLANFFSESSHFQKLWSLSTFRICYYVNFNFKTQTCMHFFFLSLHKKPHTSKCTHTCTGIQIYKSLHTHLSNVCTYTMGSVFYAQVHIQIFSLFANISTIKQSLRITSLLFEYEILCVCFWTLWLYLHHASCQLFSRIFGFTSECQQAEMLQAAYTLTTACRRRLESLLNRSCWTDHTVRLHTDKCK